MPRFQYTARDSKSKVYRGTVDAPSAAAVAASLRSEGYYVTSVKQVSSGVTVRKELFPKRVTKKDIAVFCRQMGTLLHAGVPITEALHVTRNQTSNPTLVEALKTVLTEVQTGTSLSEAMDKFPKVFPQLLVRMIEAGETSGTLDTTFENMAIHYKRDYDLQQKIIGALTYPAAVMVIAIIVVILLITVVIPNFIDMFAGMGTDLPAPTRIMMAVGNFSKTYWPVLIGGIIALVLGLAAYIRTEKGRQWKDRFLLKVPVVGNLLVQMEITRFSRTFAVMMAGGIPIVQSLNMITKLVGNTKIKEAFAQATDDVRKGGSLSLALAKSKVFPEMVTQMLEIGENTGSIDMILDNLAEFYDGEVDNQVKALTTLIEPLVIGFLGIIVAMVVASVMLPMFEMMGQMGGM
ncbi:MAG: type II secretion system F family protein [Firmicutes bacterium]|nr:type II secretion system F family protein [Bacillota bacterium]